MRSAHNLVTSTDAMKASLIHTELGGVLRIPQFRMNLEECTMHFDDRVL